MKVLAVVVAVLSVLWIFAMIMKAPSPAEDDMQLYYYKNPTEEKSDGVIKIPDLPTKEDWMIGFGGAMIFDSLFIFATIGMKLTTLDKGLTATTLLLSGWKFIWGNVMKMLTQYAFYNHYSEAFCVHPDFMAQLGDWPLALDWMARYCCWYDTLSVFARGLPVILSALCLGLFVLIDRHFMQEAEAMDQPQS